MRLLLLLCLIFTCHCGANEQIFSSPVNQVNLLELYTSQGCSSCPAAEHYLSLYKQNDKLWNSIIPVAFHVDYWDELGWHDRYSNKDFSQRQRDYARKGNVQGVYTPGFVLNGQEWRGYFGTKKLPLANNRPGKLELVAGDKDVTLRFYPESDRQTRYQGHIAVIGFNLQERILAGENQDKILIHDFVVLGYNSFTLLNQNDIQQQSANWPTLSSPATQKGIVAWVTQQTSPSPIQAVGGKLAQ
ncbi:DUF1223 domain-containing protein [Neptunicella sp. SCSIO 80796]|uniref:DUF1223 domain-containing protein n=1 Tax=Neptunicella plasticusilytica TaxID=3117012 RepID=UPI003A4DE6EE